MLDERLTKQEEKDLLGEDIYDLHDIFDNDEDAIKKVCEITNRTNDDVLNELISDGSITYSLSNCNHYSCFKLSTGRFIIIELY